MSDLIGSTISHYRIVSLLGAGGMGTVYRAHDERLDRDLALKVLPTATMDDDTARARLLREARTASSLKHPHIAHVYEVGEDRGRDFIAMELVEGRTLSETIPPAGFSPEALFRYGFQIADAMAYAHDHGVIHRDLKSSNIMLTAEGWVKVLDFGLAKRVREGSNGGAPPDLGLTSTGVVMGTPTHLAPEVLGGAAADARSDVWAFGIVLYEMASKGFPFAGASMAALAHAIATDPPKPLGERVPVGIQTVIQRCLAKEPGQRYQKAGEVRAAIEAVQGATGPHEVKSRRGTIARWGVLALLVGGLIAFVWRGFKPFRGGMPPGPATSSVSSPAGPLAARASLVQVTREGAQPLALGSAVRPGDHLALDFQCADTCHVYVFDEDDHGHAFVLFPIAGLATTNPLPGGTEVRLPGTRDGQAMSWTVTSAGGGESIYVVASRSRLDDLEVALSRVPRAAAAGANGYAAVGSEAMLALRGIGGLEASPDEVPSESHLRDLFPRLVHGAENRPDLWLWQTRLRSLSTASAK